MEPFKGTLQRFSSTHLARGDGEAGLFAHEPELPNALCAQHAQQMWRQPGIVKVLERKEFSKTRGPSEQTCDSLDKGEARSAAAA